MTLQLSKKMSHLIFAELDRDLNCRKYPKIALKLRAPIELENLLPYNLEYRIYDKNTDQNWRSYLRKGGIMPVHSVELGHLVLLNVAIQDSGKSALVLQVQFTNRCLCSF
jgi:hypothetical protein